MAILILTLQLLSLKPVGVQSVVFLPPDMSAIEKPAEASMVFTAYLQFLESNTCFMGYQEILSKLDQWKCGSPDTPMSDLQTCLVEKGWEVVLVTATPDQGRIAFQLGDEYLFSFDEVLAKLAELHCGDAAPVVAEATPPPTTMPAEEPTASEPEPVVSTPPPVEPTRPEPKPVSKPKVKVNYDAFLLGSKDGRAEDGFKVRVSLESEKIMLFDIETSDEIPIYLDGVIEVRTGEPFEIVTREEVFYLQFVDQSAQIVKRLGNVNRN